MPGDHPSRIPPAMQIKQQLDRLSRHARSQPDNRPLQFSLGVSLCADRRVLDAEPCFLRCFRGAGLDAEVRAAAALAASDGRLAAALNALADLPADSALRRGGVGLALAVLHVARAAWAPALRCLDDVELPALAAARHAWRTSLLHAQGQLADAIASAQAWCALDEADPASRGYLALLHLDGNHLERASALADAALALDDQDCHAKLVQGELALLAREGERARLCFEAVTRRSAQEPRAWLGLGWALVLSDRRDEGLRALRKGLDLSTCGS